MMPVNNRIPATFPANHNFTEEISSSGTVATNETRSHEDYYYIWKIWERDAPRWEERERQFAVQVLQDYLRNNSDTLVLSNLPLSSFPELPAHIKSLTLNNSEVELLPPLPPGLEKLNIAHN